VSLLSFERRSPSNPNYTCFSILIKTGFSSVEVNEHKVNHIVGINSSGKFFKAKYGSNSGKGPSLPGNASRSGAAVRHNEGDAVGHGASAIGSENMGHRLLSKMGLVVTYISSALLEC
jgi:hypothetical protein